MSAQFSDEADSTQSSANGTENILQNEGKSYLFVQETHWCSIIDILHCPRSSNRAVQLIVHSMAFIDGSSNKDWEGGLRSTDLRDCISINILYRTIVLHTCIKIIIAFSYPFTGVIFGICLAVCQVELIVVAIATGLIVHFVTKGCIKQNLTLSQDRSENTAELTKQLHATKIHTDLLKQHK